MAILAPTSTVLLQAGFEVVVLDNLCDASAESLRRVADHLEATSVHGDWRTIGLAGQKQQIKVFLRNELPVSVAFDKVR